jgi:hypothetical protein
MFGHIVENFPLVAEEERKRAFLAFGFWLR